MSEKNTKKPKKHRKSEVSEGEPTVSESKPEPEDTQDVTPDVFSEDSHLRKKPKGTKPKPEKSKKQKRTDNKEQLEDSTTRSTQDAMQPKLKKSKKRKQTEGSEGGNESTNPGADDDTQPKPKKSRKRKEGHKDEANYPPSLDPSNDESLAEQSRKALAYAYERFEAGETWKFNKARQNWLLRNFWSEKAIPESYIPLVVKYFAELKGGSREKLIETCNSKIAAAANTEIVGGNPQLADGPAATDRGSSRAQLLLQSLQSI